MKSYLLIIVFIVVTHSGWAQQEKGTIEGTILDTSFRPLFGININLKNTDLGTSTNSKGRFALSNVPAGNQTLLISGVGFEPIEKEVDIRVNKTVTLDFILSEGVVQLRDVVVFGNNPQKKSTTSLLPKWPKLMRTCFHYPNQSRWFQCKPCATSRISFYTMRSST